MNISTLNKEWTEFVEEQKLYLLLKSEDKVYDFLLNIRFSEPFYQNIPGFLAYKIDVEYVGGIDVNRVSKKFNLGCYEFEYTNRDYYVEEIETDWEINSGRTEFQKRNGEGVYLNDYFSEMGFSSDFFIEEMFDKFMLRQKIEKTFIETKVEKNKEKNNEQILLYNDTNVKMIEERGDLFLVLHDGIKIPFAARN